jgi:hypothetical protein
LRLLRLFLAANGNRRAQNDQRGGEHLPHKFSNTHSNFTDTNFETPASSIVTP